ncbi:MAG: TetR/AcrR family transcriptional regulator [Acidobacteriia bacterium]|nr:TetR/AcrR family transcriptional regulator [Terriglobia bacterium]
MPALAKSREPSKRASSLSLREQIRSAARDLFAREGFESVSMRRIGAAVGCSPMAMYRHYANKEELLVSICEETFGEMIRRIDAGREKPGTPIEKLRRCIRTIIDFHLTHPNHYKVTFMTEIPPGPTAERRLAVGQPALDRLRRGIRECAEASGREIDLEMTTQIVRVSMYGLVSALIVTGKVYPWKDPERLKTELIATVTRQFE